MVKDTEPQNIQGPEKEQPEAPEREQTPEEEAKETEEQIEERMTQFTERSEELKEGVEKSEGLTPEEKGEAAETIEKAETAGKETERDAKTKLKIELAEKRAELATTEKPRKTERLEREIAIKEKELETVGMKDEFAALSSEVLKLHEKSKGLSGPELEAVNVEIAEKEAALQKLREQRQGLQETISSLEASKGLAGKLFNKETGWQFAKGQLAAFASLVGVRSLYTIPKWVQERSKTRGWGKEWAGRLGEQGIEGHFTDLSVSLKIGAEIKEYKTKSKEAAERLAELEETGGSQAAIRKAKLERDYYLYQADSLAKEKGGKTSSEIMRQFVKTLELTEEGAKKNTEFRNRAAQIIKACKKEGRTLTDKETKEIQTLIKERGQTKTSGMQAIREGLNTTLAATGAIALRLPANVLFDAAKKFQALKREEIAKARKEAIEKAKATGDIEAIQKARTEAVKLGGKKLAELMFVKTIANGAVDTYKALAFKGEGKSRAQVAMDFGKATSTLSRYFFMGMGLTSGSVERSVDNLLNATKGNISLTEIGDNLFANAKITVSRYGKVVKTMGKVAASPIKAVDSILSPALGVERDYSAEPYKTFEMPEPTGEPLGPPVPEAIKEVVESYQGYEYKGEKSAWELAKSMGNSLTKGELGNRREGVQDYYTDKIKDIIVDQLKEKGINPDKVTPEQLKGLDYESIVEKFGSKQAFSDTLSEAEISQIEQNRAKIEIAFKENPKAPRISENYDRAIKGKALLTREQFAEIKLPPVPETTAEKQEELINELMGLSKKETLSSEDTERLNQITAALGLKPRTEVLEIAPKAPLHREGEAPVIPEPEITSPPSPEKAELPVEELPKTAEYETAEMLKKPTGLEAIPAEELVKMETMSKATPAELAEGAREALEKGDTATAKSYIRVMDKAIQNKQPLSDVAKIAEELKQADSKMDIASQEEYDLQANLHKLWDRQKELYDVGQERELTLAELRELKLTNETINKFATYGQKLKIGWVDRMFKLRDLNTMRETKARPYEELLKELRYDEKIKEATDITPTPEEMLPKKEVARIESRPGLTEALREAKGKTIEEPPTLKEKEEVPEWGKAKPSKGTIAEDIEAQRKVTAKDTPEAKPAVETEATTISGTETLQGLEQDFIEKGVEKEWENVLNVYQGKNQEASNIQRASNFISEQLKYYKGKLKQQATLMHLRETIQEKQDL